MYLKKSLQTAGPSALSLSTCSVTQQVSWSRADVSDVFRDRGIIMVGRILLCSARLVDVCSCCNRGHFFVAWTRTIQYCHREQTTKSTMIDIKNLVIRCFVQCITIHVNILNEEETFLLLCTAHPSSYQPSYQT